MRISYRSVIIIGGIVLLASCSPGPRQESAVADDTVRQDSEAMPQHDSQEERRETAERTEPTERVALDDDVSAAGEGVSSVPIPSNAPEAMASDRIRGRVAIVGSTPFTSVVLRREAGSVALVGELEPELRRLSGATIEVSGRRVDATPPHTSALEVSAYEIVAIDGRRPRVGQLAIRDGEAWLDNGDSVRLLNLPRELRERHGARVWVIGNEEPGGLTIISHGIISPE